MRWISSVDNPESRPRARKPQHHGRWRPANPPRPRRQTGRAPRARQTIFRDLRDLIDCCARFTRISPVGSRMHCEFAPSCLSRSPRRRRCERPPTTPVGTSGARPARQAFDVCRRYDDRRHRNRPRDLDVTGILAQSIVDLCQPAAPVYWLAKDAQLVARKTSPADSM